MTKCEEPVLVSKSLFNEPGLEDPYLRLMLVVFCVFGTVAERGAWHRDFSRVQKQGVSVLSCLLFLEECKLITVGEDVDKMNWAVYPEKGASDER